MAQSIFSLKKLTTYVYAILKHGVVNGIVTFFILMLHKAYVDNSADLQVFLFDNNALKCFACENKD